MTASAARPRWSSFASERRQLVALAVGVLLVIGLAVGLGLALTPTPAVPPDTGAASLVPADALAYLNVSLDRRRPGVRQASGLASRLPGYSGFQTLVGARLAALFGSPHPAWLGDEASLAVLPSGGARAGSLVLLSARRPSAARREVDSLPSSTAVYYRGGAERRLSGGSYVTVLGRYVVAGQLPSVQAAVDVFHGAASLASDVDFRRASSGEPAARVLDLYAPASGVSQLLGGRTGLLGAVRVMLLAPGLSAASASLSAAPGGLRVQVHTVFASAAARSGGGSVDGTVLRQMPGASAFGIDLQHLPAAAPRLLAAAAQLGVGGAIGPLLARLGHALHAEGYNLTPLLNLFSQQTAVGVINTAGRPDLLLLTRTNDPSAARILLAGVAPPLVSLFPAAGAGPGQAPLFTGRQIDGMTIHQLQLGPGLQIDYAIYHHLVAASTSVVALTSLTRSGATLGAGSGFRTAFGASPRGAGSLVFSDLKVLSRLGEQTGLLHGAAFARLAPDLDRISVIGLRATSDKTESTSELYFNIP